MAGTFGTVIGDSKLQKMGVQNEIISLSIATLIGFCYGAILCMATDKYGDSNWPTYEMTSRYLKFNFQSKISQELKRIHKYRDKHSSKIFLAFPVTHFLSEWVLFIQNYLFQRRASQFRCRLFSSSIIRSCSCSRNFE